MIKSLRIFLREWLGIKDEPEPSDHTYVRMDNIKEAVEDAIYEAFLPELSIQQRIMTYWDRPRDKEIRGTLQKQVEGLVGKEVEHAVAQKISELLEPERFIDGVVERIKRKQLVSKD